MLNNMKSEAKQHGKAKQHENRSQTTWNQKLNNMKTEAKQRGEKPNKMKSEAKQHEIRSQTTWNQKLNNMKSEAKQHETQRIDVWNCKMLVCCNIELESDTRDRYFWYNTYHDSL